MYVPDQGGLGRSLHRDPVPAPVMPGSFQNFVKTPIPLSQETVNAQQFPYHTFLVVDKQSWVILRQHTLIINPQDVTVTEPVKAQVIQTVGGAYVDDFGRGLPEVTISGHTGWRLKPMPDGSGLQDGWQAFKALRNDVFRFFTDAKDKVRTYLRNPNYEMRWYDWAKKEFYIVQPMNFQLQQSVSNPLFYQYTINLTCLQDLSASFSNTIPAWHGIIRTSGSSAMPSSTKIGFDVNNLSALASSLHR